MVERIPWSVGFSGLVTRELTVMQFSGPCGQRVRGALAQNRLLRLGPKFSAESREITWTCRELQQRETVTMDQQTCKVPKNKTCVSNNRVTTGSKWGSNNQLVDPHQINMGVFPWVTLRGLKLAPVLGHRSALVLALIKWMIKLSKWDIQIFQIAYPHILCCWLCQIQSWPCRTSIWNSHPSDLTGVEPPDVLHSQGLRQGPGHLLRSDHCDFLRCLTVPEKRCAEISTRKETFLFWPYGCLTLHDFFWVLWPTVLDTLWHYPMHLIHWCRDWNPLRGNPLSSGAWPLHGATFQTAATSQSVRLPFPITKHCHHEPRPLADDLWWERKEWMVTLGGRYSRGNNSNASSDGGSLVTVGEWMMIVDI